MVQTINQILVILDIVSYCGKNNPNVANKNKHTLARTFNIERRLSTLSSIKLYFLSIFKSSNKDKKVIAPVQWFGKTGYTKDHDTKDLIPNDWIRINDGQE